MKCPKCGYLGFDDGDRCKNCGYNFSLSPFEPVTPRPALHNGAPMRPTAEPRVLTPPAPRGRRLRPEAATGGDGDAASFDRAFDRVTDSGPLDLPLFDLAGDGTAPRATPPARPPLSVRKPTPTPTRLRQRFEPPATSADLDLGLDGQSSSAAPTPAPPAAVVPAPATRPVALAGPARRLSAVLIDIALMGTIDVAVLYFTLRLAGLTPAEFGVLPRVPLAAFYLLLNLGYVVIFTGTVGQTLGKMATGIAVAPEDGSRIDLGRSAVRTLGCLITLATAGLGFIPALFGDQRALHDRLARTRVHRRTS
jgi:uncharacterized RDD family membrane protein YckC